MKQTRGPAGQQVLLVEDETRLREMLLRAMREMGFEPDGAASAESALRLMDQTTYPVVIVDLNLPGAGGMEMLRSIRQRWPQTQAIILTGFGDLEAAKQAIHLDVVDFLTKPCALGDLEIALGRAFQRLHQPPIVDLESEEAPDAQATAASDEDDAAEIELQSHGLEFTPREGTEALSMEDVERRTILAALEKHGGNRTAAAAELGISIRKLYYRLAQYQSKGFLTQ